MTTLRHIITSAETETGSGRALAAKLGVTPATLCRWKSGQTAPRWDHFLRMCRIASVDPFCVELPPPRP